MYNKYLAMGRNDATIQLWDNHGYNGLQLQNEQCHAIWLIFIVLITIIKVQTKILNQKCKEIAASQLGNVRMACKLSTEPLEPHQSYLALLCV